LAATHQDRDEVPLAGAAHQRPRGAAAAKPPVAATRALRCVEERLALLPKDPEALRLREEIRRATSGA